MHAPPHSFGSRMQPAENDLDAAVRQTDSDAALARFSAVQKHYFQDPFIRPLLPRGAHLQPARPPLINVGTYLRSEAIDSLVTQWLALSALEGKRCQIVSLGAGSDTRFWRIASGPQKDQLATYIEIDFPENTMKKAMSIRKSRELSGHLGKHEEVTIGGGGTSLHSPKYHLLPIDMRQPPSEALASSLCPEGQTPLLSPHLPTLLLFECVLAYMAPSASNAIIQWFSDYQANSQEDVVLGGIVYEMFGLNDSFGRVMLNNLKARNVELPGVEPYPTFASLPLRFLRLGFGGATAVTLKDVRRTYTSEDELERISELELLDEIEELELVLQHYAITWGLKISDRNGRLNDAWKRWGLKHR